MLLCGGSPGGAEPKVLRVCADPDNLPFSNDKLEGFENKIAALVTQDLGAQLSYTWWPHQRGLIRRTLNQDLVRCAHRRSQRVRSGALDDTVLSHCLCHCLCEGAWSPDHVAG